MKILYLKKKKNLVFFTEVDKNVYKQDTKNWNKQKIMLSKLKHFVHIAKNMNIQTADWVKKKP